MFQTGERRHPHALLLAGVYEGRYVLRSRQLPPENVL